MKDVENETNDNGNAGAHDDDGEYVQRVTEDYDSRVFDLTEMFPDIRMRLKQNRKTHKIEMGAEVHSVFDIA